MPRLSLSSAWPGGGFLEVLGYQFVSFGVHDLMDQKLVRDFVLVLLGNMGQNFFLCLIHMCV